MQRDQSNAYDNIGVIIEENDELLVVSSHFQEEPQIATLSDFVDKPYIKRVAIRSLSRKPANLEGHSVAFLQG